MINTKFLGKYRRLEKLSEGAFGQVYKAEDQETGQLVALKVLNWQLSTDTKLVSSFERRSQLAKSLRHPNLVAVYDIGKISDVFFIAMEFLEGITLEVIVEREDLLDTGLVLNYLRQLSNALDYLHHNNVVYLDVHPNNILIVEHRGAILTDPPVTRVLEWGQVVRTDQPWGRPEYISPEQALKKTDADWRADIYSLGIVAYELLTGYLPFKCFSPQETIKAQINSDPTLPTSLNHQLPEAINDILFKALAKDKQVRYQSAGSFYKDLAVHFPSDIAV